VKRLLVLGAALLAGVAIGAVWPDRSLEAGAAEYCRMVWVHQRDAHYGWPDYAGVYATQCHADGTINEEYLHGK